MKHRSLLVLLLLVLVSLYTACGREYEFNGIVYNPPMAAPEIDGLSKTGEAFQIDSLKGNVVLLYFGYTNCPDVCPLTMGQISTIFHQLGDDASDLRIVFASTDPERDTPVALARYLDLFDPSFLGVQIPPSNLADVMQAYGGLAEKDPIPEKKSADRYTVTHSNWIYAIDRQGDLRLIFSSQLQTQQILEDVQYLLNE